MVQVRMTPKNQFSLYLSLAFMAIVASLAVLFQLPVKAEEVVDEVHYSFHEDGDKVVFSWRGDATIINYGLTDSYGMSATASNSLITPVDNIGPFKQAILTGLQENATYHYQIGNGADHTFRTKPTGDFTWVDVGDTKSSICAPWTPQEQQLIAEQQPHFVTHGGDVAIANECGTAAIHQFYKDVEVWSRTAAFQPVWGNHEYGSPTAHAPAGTPRDSLANYKGRHYITNAQTVPTDTATQIKHPGCGEETASTTNTCRGEDWGYFSAGKVLFVSYPEVWSGAMTDWKTKVDGIFAAAQANAGVDYIVTYGHRPAYTSINVAPDPNVQSVINDMAKKYSPSATNPGGKYVLNVGHHMHSQEVFKPINGLVHITNGAGGQGLATWGTTDPNSIFRTQNFGILKGQYNALDKTLKIELVCGPDFPQSTKDNCAYGQVLYTQTFSKTAQPTIKEWVTNGSVETALTGWTGVYGASSYVKIERSTSFGAHSGTAAIKVTGLTGASNLSSGFNDSPRWVQSAVAGKTYTASVWVKTQAAGQTVNLRVREWNGATAVGDKKVTLNPSSTAWQQITLPYAATQNGTQLSFAVYGGDVDAGEYFLADDMSVTSPQ